MKAETAAAEPETADEPQSEAGSDIGTAQEEAASEADTAPTEAASDAENARVDAASKADTDQVDAASKADTDQVDAASKADTDQVDAASKADTDQVDAASDADPVRTEPATGTDGGQPEPAFAEGEQRAPASGAAAAPAVVEDLFAWRSDPRLSNLAAADSDSFDWLAGSAVPGGERTRPDVSVPAAEFGTSESRAGAMEEGRAPATPRQPVTPMPEAALPYSFPDRTGDHRPENLADWTGSKPGRDRPRSLDDLPAARKRPQTLDEWLSRPSRPETGGDVPAPRVSPADAVSGSAGEADPQGPAEARTDPEPAGFIRRPQTLDEWLKGGPVGPERQETLGDSPTGGIRRPKTLDDWLSGATPTGPSTPGENAARPATLADDPAVRRRAGNGGPHGRAGKPGEDPYDRSGRRPSSLADHPAPASRAGRKPAGDEPEPDPAPQP